MINLNINLKAESFETSCSSWHQGRRNSTQASSSSFSILLWRAIYGTAQFASSAAQFRNRTCAICKCL